MAIPKRDLNRLYRPVARKLENGDEMPTHGNPFLPSGPLSAQACRTLLAKALALVTASSAQCHTEASWLLEKASGLSQSEWLAYPHTVLSAQAVAQLNDLLKDASSTVAPSNTCWGKPIFTDSLWPSRLWC